MDNLKTTAFWGVEIKPGKPYTLSPKNCKGRLHLSQVTLGSGRNAAADKSILQCNVGKSSPLFLCSLFPAKAESCQLNLEFDEIEDVRFSVIGPQSVHLCGFYLSSRQLVTNCDDSESFGEDIANTESERSTGNEYDASDSFINDSDDPTVGSEETLDKKPRNGTRKSKRLRKKYVVSDSEEGGISKRKRKDNNSISDGETNGWFSGSSLFKKLEAERKSEKRSEDGSSQINALIRADDLVVCEPKREEKIVIQEKEEAANLKSIDKKVDIKSSEVTPVELKIEELGMGKQNGRIATRGKKVTVNYFLKLMNGKVVDERSPLKFILGSDDVIDGVNVGLEGMQVGAKRKITIPPSMGFGNKGYRKRVPPNAWLVCDVELVRVRR